MTRPALMFARSEERHNAIPKKGASAQWCTRRTALRSRRSEENGTTFFNVGGRGDGSSFVRAIELLWRLWAPGLVQSVCPLQALGSRLAFLSFAFWIWTDELIARMVRYSQIVAHSCCPAMLRDIPRCCVIPGDRFELLNSINYHQSGKRKGPRWVGDHPGADFVRHPAWRRVKIEYSAHVTTSKHLFNTSVA